MDDFKLGIRTPQSAGRFEVAVTPDDNTVTWSVTNSGTEPTAIDSVGIAWDAGPANEAQLFVNGYQSWSACGWRTLGIDADPSAKMEVRHVRAAHHADPAVTTDLRSELVGVFDPGSGAPLVRVGFAGAIDHDATVRARIVSGRVELEAEAFLGGAVLAPGETRTLHPVGIESGDDVNALLADWADDFGAAAGGRTGAPYQVGWCSWYHYFGDVTEHDLRDNLALATDWPFDVFQLDDGFQSAIGDWTTTDATFPSGLDDLATDIADAGLVPGLWIAPFLAHLDSEIGRAHPDWFAREPDSDHPIVGMANEHWNGFVHVLDTTHPEVLAHLEALAAELVAMGWRYLKLDFTYAPSFPGRYYHPGRTPAQRVRAGYDAIRRGAGDDTFILGCGAPLGPCVGVVDGMRIGPDVAPHWDPRPGGLAGYENTGPSTSNAWQSMWARSFLHRRWWINDPDCVMLRAAETDLTPAATHAWADAVARSGGMALVSDDLALLDTDARARLDEVLERGRAADVAAITGTTPKVPVTPASEPR